MDTQPGILGAAEMLCERLGPGDLDSTLQAITRAVVDVLPGVHHASLSMRHVDGTLGTYAASSDLAADLDEQQFRLQEGPCFDGATRDPFSVSADLLEDRRYLRYGPVAAERGIRSQAGIRLFECSRTIGALNIFSRDPGAFEDAAAVGRMFSHQAAVALAYAAEIQGLNEALRSRARIGQAVGIVMERHQLPEQQAFALLTRLSEQGVQLSRVADELVASVSQP